MQKILPGANVARILWPWGNSKPVMGGDSVDLEKSAADFYSNILEGIPDCRTTTPPYFNDACFNYIDYAVQQATDCWAYES